MTERNPAEPASPRTSGGQDWPAGAPMIPRVEIGWMVHGVVDAETTAAIDRARELLFNRLDELLPTFDWRIVESTSGPPVPTTSRERIVDLLDHAVTERELRSLDFSLVVTSADLEGHYKSFALAAMSQSLASGVISTAHVDSRARRENLDGDERCRRLAQRLCGLALHVLGHLLDLEHDRNPNNYMYDIKSVEDLDETDALSERQRDQLQRTLTAVADPRLEEQPRQHARGRVGFYLASIWLNRKEILHAVIEARPWQIPYRLTRLTAAALSAVLILLMTSEAWDLGISQPSLRVTGLSIVAIALTGAYVIARKRLLARRGRRQLNEHKVVADVSTVSVVLLGLVATYVVLMGAAALVEFVLFNDRLAASFTPSQAGTPATGAHLILAAFVSAIGIVVGALGASFEDERYLRHVLLVDEET